MKQSQVFQGKTKVIFNKRVAPGHYVIRLKAPVLAKTVQAGQFVQINVGADPRVRPLAGRHRGLPLLRRPFSILSASESAIDILYAVVGEGTKILSKKRTGDSVDVLGPLGNSWGRIKSERKAILIGGGVGIPPLFFLAQREKVRRSQIEVFLGARHKSLLLCQKEFQGLEIPVHVATDDGSAGFKGYVTDLVRRDVGADPRVRPLVGRHRGLPLRPYIYACGPESMLKAVAKIAKELQLGGEVSMEAPMACGFGICVGCAVPVVGGKYKLCCYDGSVFKINEIDWNKIDQRRGGPACPPAGKGAHIGAPLQKTFIIS